MALIQFGSIVTNMRGKLGGHYFSHSLGGSSVASNPRQRKIVPLVNGSGGGANPYQRSEFSNVLLYVVRSWKAVSAANKLAWAASAPNFPTINKLGEPVKPSGYHCYVHVNFAYLLINNTLLSTPPANTVGVLPLTYLINTLTSSSFILNFEVAVPTGYTAYVKATANISAGVKPPANYFKTITSYSAGATGSLNITTAYQQKYGAMITGQWIWTYVILVNNSTGIKGNPSPAALVVS